MTKKSPTLRTINNLLHELYAREYGNTAKRIELSLQAEHDRSCAEARIRELSRQAEAAFEQRGRDFQKLLTWLSNFENPWIMIKNKSGERVF
jgi:hypothetical protein